jgi:hypothetical protein
MPALKFEKEPFLIRRKGTLLAKKEKSIKKNMGKSHGFEPVADPVRGR